MEDSALTPEQRAVLAWFDTHRRDLPWRVPTVSPWGVLVSEVMLAQTPVTRVVPVWAEWMLRWPTPAALAVEPAGEAVRAWGRLGYPRRALRLHEAAGVLVARHDGAVPDDETALRALPGVGEYTAAAVRAFAFGRRSLVLDTNVRRVLARWRGGEALPSPGITVSERSDAAQVLPTDDATAARWSVAVMELGALVCTAAAPACRACPLQTSCRWRAAGSPPPPPGRRRTQAWHGTDRQCRGVLLAVLRDSPGPVSRTVLARSWDDAQQRERALDSLVTDGLVEPIARGRYRLPS